MTSLWVPHRRDMIRLGTEMLDLLEADRDYVRLHAAGSTYLIRGTMQEMQRRLDPARFIRVHRSAIVAIDRIHAVENGQGGAWTVHLLTGQAVRVGRSFRPSLRKVVEDAA